MFSMLWNLLAFLLALGVLVTVHEFGHFWVARRCGVCVERFCIGFGRALWCRTDRQGTGYVIALIPLGGYVKMLDERVEAVAPARRHQAFNNKSIWQRAAIVSAGPIANFLFAILAYWLVFIIGVPAFRPVVGEISPQSIAAKAEVSPGMELKSVDGIETPDWESVRLALVAKIGDMQTEVGMAPFGSSQQVIKTLDLRQWNFEPDKQDPVVALGIIPRGPQIESVLAGVQPDSAAQKAGLHVGDRIVKIDDQRLDGWQTLVKRIHDSPGKPLALDIERNGLPLFLTLIPDTKAMEKGKSVGFAGIIPKVLPLSEEYKTIHQYGWPTALYQASHKTWYLMRLTVSMLGKLIIGDVKLSNLSGPISIAQGAGASAGSGLVYYLMFLALISVNLGIINLFPLPVLDGGHLLFLAIEKLKGRPVSERVQDYSYRMGSIMLVLLMGLALFNDFSRL
ncbi:sigma E protease regulator RseP [Serratia symbiotica]|uniref:sigma E protease regulator RseP n=1 Tax=Serratia symbiotica TaxID=138074 RepID=UPI002091C1FF|nr:sigma E protease regulator RseP [Serratia symbiotica]USS95548.1 sigma E protease regulator RseP [Serratia symbiotica]